MTDWMFIYRKGFRRAFLEKVLPSHLPRTAKFGRLKFYHWKALPPEDLSHIHYGQEFYEQTMKLSGNVAVDIGSHVGSYALRLAGRFRVVYAFEPNPATYHLLSLNLKRNHISNVFALKMAVSDSSGPVTLRVPSLFSPGSTIAEKHYDYLKFDREIRTTKVSLDEYFQMSSRGVGKIDFVKIDVEGHELAVLKGMEEIVNKHHPVLQLEVHSEADSSIFCDCQPCRWVRARYSRVQMKSWIGAKVHWLFAS